MKRLVITASLVVAMMLSGTVSASATTLATQLVSQRQLPSWSRYAASAADLARCPESNFQTGTSRTEARVFFTQTKTETLFAEKIVTSSDPTKAYAQAIAKTADCPAATTIDGNATFQRIKALHVGDFGVPVRAFSLYAVVGGAAVTGCVLFARKGNVVLDIGELSMGSINAKAFKAEVVVALKNIRA